LNIYFNFLLFIKTNFLLFIKTNLPGHKRSSSIVLSYFLDEGIVDCLIVYFNENYPLGFDVMVIQLHVLGYKFKQQVFVVTPQHHAV